MLAFAAILALASSAAASSVVVSTPLGPVEGTRTGNVDVFRGIPYAQPPVGALRWRATEPVKAWGPNPLVANTDAPGCPQKCELPPHTCPPTVSEDCLFLNVFAPAGATNAPVMVWIHGGNFKQGYPGGLLYNGSSLADTQGVIVVSIAYRLGVLGWLYTGGGSIEGMYGALDQQEAMRWVRSNIASFGGDPSSITLVGQSAGAMSVATHMTLPSSDGLFERGILESDPFTSPFRTPDEYIKVSAALGKQAGCAQTSGAALDACLRNLTADALVDAQVEVEKDVAVNLPHVLEAFLPWTPVVDPSANGSIPALELQPRVAFSTGQAQQKPMIVGTVANEAVLFIYEAFEKPLAELEYAAYLAVVFGLGDALEVSARYPLPDSDKADGRAWLAHIGTKALFKCPTRNASMGFSRPSPTWVYHFDHVMSFSKEVWGPDFKICWDEVCHAEELAFVFHPDASRLNLTFTQDELVLSADMESYWGSFIRTGNPNAKGSTATVWPEFNSNTQQTMLLQTPKSAVQSHNLTSDCDWWDSKIGYDFP